MNGTVLVFGATGAVGSMVARALVQSGRRVHLAGRDDCGLRELADRLRCDLSLMDASEPTSIERTFGEVSGPLDAVVWAIGSKEGANGSETIEDVRLRALAPGRMLRCAVAAMSGARAPGRVILCREAVQDGVLVATEGSWSLSEPIRGLARAASPPIIVRAVVWAPAGGAAGHGDVPLSARSAILGLLSGEGGVPMGELVWVRTDVPSVPETDQAAGVPAA